MLKNYLTIAFRNLYRHRSQFFINLTGLIIGFSAFLLISLVLQYEESYDNFHHDTNRIFRVYRENKTNRKDIGAGIPFPVHSALQNEYPQLQAVADIYSEKNVQVTLPGNKKFMETKGVFYADDNFFQLFNFGQVPRVLGQAKTAVITRSIAEKYFGDRMQAVGSVIKIGGTDITIKGIIDNPPVNSDLPAGIVISLATLGNRDDWKGISDYNYVFVKLKQGLTADKMNAALKGFIGRHVAAAYAGYELKVQPLNELHFDKQLGNFNNRTFGRELIAALSLISIFLLLIACVNFVNLSTAGAVKRAKEVGVRKVLGGSPLQLLLQFLGEAAMTSLLAFIVAILLSVALLPFINQLLDIHAIMNMQAFMIMTGVLLAVIILSGFYPALVLANFNPANAFKNNLVQENYKGLSLRRGLVILQFVIAQVLIAGTLVVIWQLRYFSNAELGFNKAAVVTAAAPASERLKEQLLQQPGVAAVSFSLAAPSGEGGWATDLRLDGNNSERPDLIVNMKTADTGYFRLYQLHLLAGMVYQAADTANGFVVNETLVKKVGWHSPAAAIGQRIQVTGKWLPVVGVVKDFHVKSLKEEIAPVVMENNKESYRVVNIKMVPGQTVAVLKAMQAIWEKEYPDKVFEYHFVDSDIAAFYQHERQLSLLFPIFAGIAILVSCLGLYGLISFMVVRKRKEIGIRKVLGAPVQHIIFLLLKEFSILILVSFLIATPLAFYIMDAWLQQFAFRIHAGAGFFVITLLGSMLIAWLTISQTAIKAALMNPVKSLANE